MKFSYKLAACLAIGLAIVFYARGMGSVSIGLIGIAVMGVAIVNSAVQAMGQSVSEQLGGPSRGEKYARIFRLDYLGRHPMSPHPVKDVMVYISESRFAVVRGGDVLIKLQIDEVDTIRVETEQEAHHRLTATRLAGLDVFACAFKQKVAGSVLVTVETRTGPIVFERLNVPKTKVLRDIAAGSAIVTSRPPS